MLRLDELIVALRERDSKRKSAAVTNSTALGLGRTRRDLRDINFRARAVSSSTRISFFEQEHFFMSELHHPRISFLMEKIRDSSSLCELRGRILPRVGVSS